MDILFYLGGVPFHIVNVLAVQLRKSCHMKGLVASLLNIKPLIGVEKENGTYVQLGQARSFDIPALFDQFPIFVVFL